MQRRGIDTRWFKVRAGFYESDDDRWIQKENGEWFGYFKGVPEAVFKSLKEALTIIWK